MILRRGTFLGVIMIAGSVQAICGGYGPEAARFVWIWLITLLEGIVQLGVSFHYRMALFSRIMQFCLMEKQLIREQRCLSRKYKERRVRS